MEAADARDGTDGADAKTARASKLVSHVIAGYRLMRVLEAEEASATLLGQHVEAADQYAAIKILHAPAGTTTAALTALRVQFNREAQALFALQHPHLLGIYALGVDVVTGNPYMVLPYPQGGTLAQRLAAGQLRLETAAEYIAQVADAVDAAHALGMIHGDLTPASILFDGADHLYVTGFRTGAGATLVSEKYVAPERLRGQAADPASDRYSLGVVLYEMVTGYVPFQGATPDIVALQHEHLPPPPPRALRPELPEQAEAVLLRALAKQPGERFASATALAEAFALSLGLSLGVESPPSESAPPGPAISSAQPQPQPEPQPEVAPHHPLTQLPAMPTAVSASPATTPATVHAVPSDAAPSAPAALPATLPPVAPRISPVLTPPPAARPAGSAISAVSPIARVAPSAAPAVELAPAPPLMSLAPGLAPAPSLPASIPAQTVPSSAQSPAPSPSAIIPAQAAPAREPGAPATTIPGAATRKYLVPPVLIRNVMLAIFALVLGTAIVAAVHVLGAVELLLTVGILALFIYCGVVLPGQAMKQEQRRARLAYQSSLGGEQPTMIGGAAQ